MADTHRLIDTNAPPKQVGVTPEGWLTDSWYLGALSKAVKRGQQIRCMILDQPIVIARTPGGEVFALRDICPIDWCRSTLANKSKPTAKPRSNAPIWRRFGRDGVCRHMPSVLDHNPYDPQRFKVRRYRPRTSWDDLCLHRRQPEFYRRTDVPPPDFGPLQNAEIRY